MSPTDSILFRFSSGTVDRPDRAALLDTLSEGKLEEADEIIESSEEFGTTDQFEALMFRTLVAFKKGDFEAARALVADALQVADSDYRRAVAYENDSAARFLLGDFEGSTIAAAAGLKLDPRLHGLWTNALAALARLERFDEVDRMLELIPKTLEFRTNVGAPTPIVALLADPDLEVVRTRSAYVKHILPLLSTGEVKS